MKRTIKRIMASLLVAVMMVTAMPLSGIDFGELFAPKASAKDISSYSVGAINLATEASASESDIYSIYLRVINDYYGKTNSGYIWRDYALYDIDGNGVKELILKLGTCESDTSLYFYGYDGDLIYLGEFNGFHGMMYGVNNSTGIYLQSASMGYESLYTISIDNNQIKVVLNYKNKVIPADQEYTQFDNYICLYKLNNVSKLKENVIYGEIITQYRNAIINNIDISDDLTHYYYIKECYIRYGFDNVNFAFYDIDNNGTEELIPSVFNDYYKKYNVFSIYTFANNNLYNFESDINNTSIGGRSWIYLYKNGSILINGSSSASESCCSIYNYKINGYTPTIVEEFKVQTKTTNEVEVSYYCGKTKISKSEFDNYIKKYTGSDETFPSFYGNATISYKPIISDDKIYNVFYEKSYIADNLLDRHGFGTTMASKQLKDILSYPSESSIVFDDLKDNNTFQAALGIWSGLGCVFEPTDKIKEELNKSQIYEALIFDFIRYSLNDENSEIYGLIKDAEKINDSIQPTYETVSQCYEIADGLKKSIEKSGQTFAVIQKAAQTSGNSVPNTISIYLESDEFKNVAKFDNGGISKVLKGAGTILSVVNSANEFYKRMNLYCMSLKMSEQMVKYLEEMKNNCTDYDFKTALTNIITSFNNYDYLAYVCGVGLGKDIILDFTGALIDDIIAISPIAWLYETWKLSYEAGKAFVNVMLNTEGIINKYYLCEAAKNIYDTSVKTIKSLSSTYISSESESDAGAYVYAVSCHRFIVNIDLDTTGKFIKAASEEGIVNLSNKLSNSIVSKVTGIEIETTYERFAKNKDSIMQSLMSIFDYMFTAWKYDEQYLKTDYPDIFPIYIENDLSADSCKPNIISAELNKSGETDVTISSSIGYIDENGYFRQYLATGYLESFIVTEKIGSTINTKSITDGYKYNSSTYSWNLKTNFYESNKFTTFPKTYSVKGVSTYTGDTIYTQSDSKTVESPTTVELVNNIDSFLIKDSNNIELADITTYHIYRRNAGDSSFSEIKTIKRNSNIYGFSNLIGFTAFVDTTAQTGKSYEYKVVKELNFTNGVTLKGTSKIIAKKYINVSESMKLNVSRNRLHASSVDENEIMLCSASVSNDDGIVLSWEKNNNATGYEIYRMSSYGSCYRVIATVDSSETSYVDTDIEDNISYQYKVVPYFSTNTGEILYSNEMSYDGSYIEEVIPSSTGCTHTYNSGEIVLSATVHCDGVKYFTCTKCGAVKTESVKYMSGNKVNSVSISDISLNKDAQSTITPTISADSGVSYKTAWKSSDSSVATIDSNGKVTGIKAGTATITCTVTDEYGNVVSDTCTVIVKDDSPASSDVVFSLNLISETDTEVKIGISLEKGNICAIDGTVYCSNNLSLKSMVKSSNLSSFLSKYKQEANFVCNKNNGKFAFASSIPYNIIGDYIICTFTKMSSNDVKSDDIVLDITNCCTESQNIKPTVINRIKIVTGKVKSVNIDDISLNYKKSTTINPKIESDSGVNYEVTYTTSNPKVATVDNNGNVYASGKGNATITCTVTDQYGNVVTDTSNVNVGYSFGQWLIVILLFGWIWY